MISSCFCDFISYYHGIEHLICLIIKPHKIDSNQIAKVGKAPDTRCKKYLR